mgnify:CR=1 FL=1
MPDRDDPPFTFRLDRIEGFVTTVDQFRQETGKSLHDFLKRPMTWTRGAQRVAPYEVESEAEFEDG